MSTHADNRHGTADRQTAGARNGLALFGGIMMVVAGLYHALTGLAALFRDQIYVDTPGYTFELDLTGWGWTHLVLGALAVATGIAVVQGATWGRLVGIGLAVLSMLATFVFLPHYPIWSLLIIAMDVAIIWGLATCLRDA